MIQLEEPQIYMVPARGKTFGKLDVQDLVGVFNKTVKGPYALMTFGATWLAPGPVAQKDLLFYKQSARSDQGQEDRHRRGRSSHAAGRAPA